MSEPKTLGTQSDFRELLKNSRWKSQTHPLIGTFFYRPLSITEATEYAERQKNIEEIKQFDQKVFQSMALLARFLEKITRRADKSGGMIDEPLITADDARLLDDNPELVSYFAVDVLENEGKNEQPGET